MPQPYKPPSQSRRPTSRSSTAGAGSATAWKEAIARGHGNPPRSEGYPNDPYRCTVQKINAQNDIRRDSTVQGLPGGHTGHRALPNEQVSADPGRLCVCPIKLFLRGEDTEAKVMIWIHLCFWYIVPFIYYVFMSSLISPMSHCNVTSSL